jgi:uncharacterized protein (DUF1330 family)
MSVTILALVTVADDAPFELATYFKVTEPLLARAGAKIIKRFSVNEVVVGHRPAKTLMIVEYPSREAVHDVFGSPEYQAIIPIRDIAFPTYQISIVGEE